MLQFIFGKCGNGKSEKLRTIIKNITEKGENKVILIVPEQSSFGNEKSMLKLLGNKNFEKMHVLSFSRIYDFVSQILKIPALNLSKDISRAIVMNLALEESARELKLYKKATGSAETASLMLKALEEMKSNKISLKALCKLENLLAENTLRQKIHELKCIFENYKILSENKLTDSFDALNILEKTISENKVFEGYTVLFDEFAYFTPQQLSIIKIILSQAKNVIMAFCREQNSSEEIQNLFAPINRTVKLVKNLAAESKTEIKEPIILNKTSRFCSPELEILGKNIFNPCKTIVQKTPQNIEIYSACSISDECEHIACRIKKLIIENGFRYKDFAVLTRNIGSYSSKIKSTFKKYDIPFFMDCPEAGSGRALSGFIFSAFDAVCLNYSAESVLKYLKTGLTGFSTEEISAVENYALLWDIKGKEWFEDFTKNPYGFEETDEIQKNETLCELNVLKERMIAPLREFKKRISKASGAEISRAVFNLLQETEVPRNLREFCNSLENMGEASTAQKEAAIWNTFMDVLGETAKILGNKKISPQKYCDIVFSAINSVDCSSIPQSVDSVTVGSAERIRLSKPKAVFLAGCVEGEFPLVPNVSEIFTGSEINELLLLGVKICDTTENFLMKERFLAYISASAPSEKLFVSWPCSSASGSGNFPSEIIKEIKEIFPNIKIFNKNSFSDEDMIWSEKSAFEICAKNFEKNSDLAFSLKNYFENSKNFKEKYHLLKKYCSENIFEFENPENAEKIFGNKIKLSASQIEKYYTCRFGYFCKYVLKAKALNAASFGALEYGNLVHFLFEKLFKKYPQNKILNLCESELEKEVESITETYINMRLGGQQNKSKRFFYIISRFKNSAKILVNHFVKEFRQSEFMLADTELEISNRGEIAPLKFDFGNNKKIEIEGKIDRVDIMKTENGTCVRIIDYKTGTKEFKLSDVLYGINVQMLIYLSAIKKNGEKKYGKVIPAGVLYFSAVKPLIESQSLNFEESSEKIDKKMCMNGLILNNASVISGMEKNCAGMFIPVSMKNGEIKKSESLANLNDLEIIENHIKNLSVKMAQCLISGKVSATPVKKKNITACKWCEYFAICRYESDRFTQIASGMKNEEALEKMLHGEDENEQ